MTTPKTGLAGRLAETFIRSKLTVLFVLASLLLGFFATVSLPREEEPQINVPMFDVFVGFPGASAEEVEERLTNVGERKFWEIPDVEYVYSTSEPGLAMFILRFKVGTDPEEAMTRVYTKTFSNLDYLSIGATQPLVKPRSIDDVPILALNLSGPGQDAYALRRQAAALRQEISAVPGVSQTEIIGGRRRQFLVHFDPAALARHRLTPLELAGSLQAANTRLPAGTSDEGDRAVAVESDALVRTVEDLKEIVVGVSGGKPVTLSDVARVTDGPDEDERDVTLWTREGASTAVTLAVSKRRGQNATQVAREVLSRIEAARDRLLDPRTEIGVTRNYGETAKEKSDELLYHMALATLSVTLLIAVFLGLREAIVVLIAIPVTLALTLLVYFLLGYTLNRITLFALIFSIGILVDDAIVVVENIHRHFAMRDGRSLWRLSVDAVAEVGNPTLLATWAVIAAILPMAFVSGLMGPYMRPIPVGASVAMLFSLGIAFVISPWAFAHILELWKPRPSKSHGRRESWPDRLYRKVMGYLLGNAPARWAYLGTMAALLLASVALVYFKKVTVKMLPFDNKNEFEVVLTLPEGSSLARTKAAADDISRALLAGSKEVELVTSYVGSAAPYNFNGLVRHYFLRERPHQADLAVNLTHKKDRKAQSHAVASSLRPAVQAIADKYGARVQVAEIPPGPPVLSTLVFEIYGSENEPRDAFARELQSFLKRSENIVDVDTYVPSPEPLNRLAVDREKATLNGLPASAIAQTAGVALGGQTVGLAHTGDKEPVEIRLRLPKELRAGLDAVGRISLMTRNGTLVPLKDLTSPERVERDMPIYHKNLQRVSYVIADVSGRQESPVYAILALRDRIQALAREKNYQVAEYFSAQPKNSLERALKWDGEWQITYEVFRDLGLAFAFALVLIYVLVVGWFKSFTIPLVVMVPIPLTLVGILPAHWGMGAFFTATSMIGFIAGAGIVVRNSIILVDFIHLRLAEGMPLKEAVIDAGAVRFRPMLLTAAAVVAGAAVILFDPIFQGLAVALMAGEVASTFLSRMAVPILYYMLARRSG